MMSFRLNEMTPRISHPRGWSSRPAACTRHGAGRGLSDAQGPRAVAVHADPKGRKGSSAGAADVLCCVTPTGADADSWTSLRRTSSCVHRRLEIHIRITAEALQEHFEDLPHQKKSCIPNNSTWPWQGDASRRLSTKNYNGSRGGRNRKQTLKRAFGRPLSQTESRRNKTKARCHEQYVNPCSRVPTVSFFDYTWASSREGNTRHDHSKDHARLLEDLVKVRA